MDCGPGSLKSSFTFKTRFLYNAYLTYPTVVSQMPSEATIDFIAGTFGGSAGLIAGHPVCKINLVGHYQSTITE